MLYACPFTNLASRTNRYYPANCHQAPPRAQQPPAAPADMERDKPGSRPARKRSIVLSAHTKVDSEDEEERRFNDWRTKESSTEDEIATNNEVPETMENPTPPMQCWNCCLCLRYRLYEEGTRKWRYCLEKDVDGTLKCHTCKHHCCPDCAIGGVEEKGPQRRMLESRHSGWAAEPGELKFCLSFLI